MDDIEQFIYQHREQLLQYLDGKAPNASHPLGPLEYVEKTLNDWALIQKRYDENEEPCLNEMAFWYALYQYEELLEIPGHKEIDPYEGLMMKNLSLARECLRRNAELPMGFYATRPA